MATESNRWQVVVLAGSNGEDVAHFVHAVVATILLRLGDEPVPHALIVVVACQSVHAAIGSAGETVSANEQRHWEFV